MVRDLHGGGMAAIVALKFPSEAVARSPVKWTRDALWQLTDSIYFSLLGDYHPLKTQSALQGVDNGK